MTEQSDDLQAARDQVARRRETERRAAAARSRVAAIEAAMRAIADPSRTVAGPWSETHLTEYRATLFVQVEDVRHAGPPTIASIAAEAQRRYDDDCWAAFKRWNVPGAPADRFGPAAVEWSERRSVELIVGLWNALATLLREAGVDAAWITQLRAPEVVAELEPVERSVAEFVASSALKYGSEVLNDLLTATDDGAVARCCAVLLPLRRALPVTFQLLGHYPCAVAAAVRRAAAGAVGHTAARPGNGQARSTEARAAVAGSGSTGTVATVHRDDALLTVKECAKVMGINKEALRSKLRRYRQKNPGSDGFVDVEPAVGGGRGRKPSVMVRLGLARRVWAGQSSRPQ